DLSRGLRSMLVELRDRALFEAFGADRSDIAADFVFPGKRSWVYTEPPHHMAAALQAAGLRHFRFHDLRHTFGSLLIQDGASLAYVKDQMGHASIQVTADVYGHLVPGAGIAWVDRLDSEPQQSATPAQLSLRIRECKPVQAVESAGLGQWAAPANPRTGCSVFVLA
ncbi:MAG: tyrosine-type recombinase/integrase, partial [Terriglobales bacterium]